MIYIKITFDFYIICYLLWNVIICSLGMSEVNALIFYRNLKLIIEIEIILLIIFSVH